jgi:hypothetical protein
MTVKNSDDEWKGEPEGSGIEPAVIIGIVACIGCFGLVCGGGVLSAIAIPNYLAMQLRAKRSEAPTNLDAIRTAEKAYHAEWDAFTSVGPCPLYVPGRTAVL